MRKHVFKNICPFFFQYLSLLLLLRSYKNLIINKSLRRDFFCWKIHKRFSLSALLCLFVDNDNDANQETSDQEFSEDPASDDEEGDVFSEYYRPYELSTFDRLHAHVMQKSCRYENSKNISFLKFNSCLS